MSDFYQAGFSTGRYKEVPPSNPYAVGSHAATEWRRGFMDGVKERHRQM